MALLEVDEKNEPVPTVIIKGELDHFNCSKAEYAIKHFLDEDTGQLVIDLSGLEYLDTAGVAMIFWTAKRLYDRRGRLMIIIPPGNVRRILEMAGVDNLPATNVYDDNEEIKAS